MVIPDIRHHHGVALEPELPNVWASRFVGPILYKGEMVAEPHDVRIHAAVGAFKHHVRIRRFAGLDDNIVRNLVFITSFNLSLIRRALAGPVVPAENRHRRWHSGFLVGGEQLIGAFLEAPACERLSIAIRTKFLSTLVAWVIYLQVTIFEPKLHLALAIHSTARRFILKFQMIARPEHPALKGAVVAVVAEYPDRQTGIGFFNAHRLPDLLFYVILRLYKRFDKDVVHDIRVGTCLGGAGRAFARPKIIAENAGGRGFGDHRLCCPEVRRVERQLSTGRRRFGKQRW